jgi:hypothetical protein
MKHGIATTETYCPVCFKVIPMYNLTCIHCGHVRKECQTVLASTATIGRSYPIGTEPIPGG